MREALGQLATDQRVIGIAAAVAIGYALVAFVVAVAGVVLDVAGGEEYAQGRPFRVEIAGYGIGYAPVVLQGGALVLVVLLAAVFARRAGADE